MRRQVIPFDVLLVLFLTGCHGEQPPPPPRVTSDPLPATVSTGHAESSRPGHTVQPKLRIIPEYAVLSADDPAIQLQAELRDGTRSPLLDLTTSVEWEVSPPGILTVDAGGFVRPTSSGEAIILARSEDFVGKATILVEPRDKNRRAWDFESDVIPILTRLGCNSGGCHGREAGQNGFHLSLFGYDPTRDFQALTRDSAGRRINSVTSATSLLIEKAIGRIPHGGGRVLSPGSDLYDALTSWIAAGAPLQRGATHGPIETVIVQPNAIWLEGPGERQLRVVARYVDGHERDVTRLADFRTRDDGIAGVSEDGLARLLRRGETDLIVRYQSVVVPVRIGSPINPDLDFQFATLPRKNLIDHQLYQRLEQLKMPPSQVADDATFLRRISLDLTGQLPRPDEIRAFLDDNDPAKRLKKVDELLGSRDFLHFWTIKLGDLLQITSSRSPGAGYYQMWLQERLMENTPWDELVRELLTAVGNPTTREGGVANYALDGPDANTRAELTAQRFLGLRLRCAQCHDHPFDVWTQSDYYGLAAFFAKVEYGASGLLNGSMPASPSLVSINPEGRVVHPRTGEVVQPRLLDGTTVDVSMEEDPRVMLAAWITDPANAYFPRAAVNWVWAQFFGRGLVDPIDELSASNPAVHPDLLNALSSHFVQDGYDLRNLIRTVTTSDAYALSSEIRPGNELGTRYFARHLPRPLSAHQMADALAHATDVPNRFPNRGPQTKAIEIFDPTVASTVLDTFGRCSRTTSCSTVAETQLSLRQSLLLIGGTLIEDKLASLDGYLDNSLDYGISMEDLVENLYLRTLCRYPTADEHTYWTQELEAAASSREAAEDLFWALLNSREFAFNH